ncbi:MAG: multiprotein bridging factor aMBF1 [Nanoarchaeota archaeon]
MCGKEDRLFRTNVEGSILSLCSSCSKFGKVISAVKFESKKSKKEIKQAKQTEKEPKEEYILEIVSNYGEIIKKKREEKGITQEEFAKQINEKISLIHKIETNHLEPGMGLARKIEKFLHINLIEQGKVNPELSKQAKSETFTIGDFIKVKK